MGKSVLKRMFLSSGSLDLETQAQLEKLVKLFCVAGWIFFIHVRVRRDFKDSGNTSRTEQSVVKRHFAFFQRSLSIYFSEKGCNGKIWGANLRSMITSVEKAVWDFCCRGTPPRIRIFTKFGNGVVFNLYVKKTREEKESLWASVISQCPRNRVTATDVCVTERCYWGPVWIFLHSKCIIHL